MSTTAKTGGQAFPSHSTMQAPEYVGMTLRDWFAGQAMAALIIGNNAESSALTLGAAIDAYTAADAMIAARSKP